MENELIESGRGDDTRELTAQAQGHALRAEVEVQATLAIRHPRNVENVFQSMMLAARRPAFQDKCQYRYNRGNTPVVGPTVYLARAFAREWGHLRYGFSVVSSTTDSVLVRGYAWDLQTGAYRTCDSEARKRIFRREKRDKLGNVTQPAGWIVADERETLELINRVGAKAERNAILALIPQELVDDVIGAAEAYAEKGIRDDVEGARKRILNAFAPLGVTADALGTYLGHPLKQASAEELTDLRALANSIREGQTTWAETLADALEARGETPAGKPKAKAGATVGDLMGTPAQEPAKRGRKPKAAEPEAAPEPRAQEPSQAEPPTEDWESLAISYIERIRAATTLTALDGLRRAIERKGFPEDYLADLHAELDERGSAL